MNCTEYSNPTCINYNSAYEKHKKSSTYLLIFIIVLVLFCLSTSVAGVKLGINSIPTIVSIIVTLLLLTSTVYIYTMDEFHKYMMEISDYECVKASNLNRMI